MMDGLVPISSLPVQVDGRNLLWRRILSHAIRTDPAWLGGNYAAQPRGFLNIMPMFDLLVQSPARLGEQLTTYAQADAHVREVVEETLEEDDADDELNPIELGAIEPLIRQVREAGTWWCRPDPTPRRTARR